MWSSYLLASCLAAAPTPEGELPTGPPRAGLGAGLSLGAVGVGLGLIVGGAFLARDAEADYVAGPDRAARNRAHRRGQASNAIVISGVALTAGFAILGGWLAHRALRNHRQSRDVALDGLTIRF